MRRQLVVLFVLAVGGVSRADESPKSPPAAPPAATPAPPPTPEQVADAVGAAIAAKDDAALKALAAKDDPDPWLVADELIRRGAFDVAEAFAKAAPRVDVEALPAYGASRRGKPDDPARRERLAKANAALQARKPADALEALGPEEPGPIEDVVGVRIAMGRGIALSALVRLDASAEAHALAGGAAERIGWLARAALTLQEGGMTAYRGSAFAAALATFEHALAVHERRGDRTGAAKTLNNLGLVHMSMGAYADAVARYERALAAFEALGDKARAAQVLGNIGIVQFRLGKYAQALATQERALVAKEALGDKAGAVGALGNIGQIQAALGAYVDALATFERVLKAMDALGNEAGVATTLRNLGGVQFALGDYAPALETLGRALSATEALGDRVGAAGSLAYIGMVQVRLGDYARALATYKRALATFEAVGDRAAAAGTLSHIAQVQLRRGEFATALLTFERALAEMETLGTRGSAAITLGDIGGVHYSLGDYAKALATHLRALSAMEALGDNAGAARVRGNIGLVHEKLGDYPAALAAFTLALAAMEARGDKEGTAAALGNIGIVQSAMGNHRQALAMHTRALESYEALGDKAGAARTLGNIGSVHFALGDDESAVKFSERAARASEKLGANPLLVSALARQARARLRSGDAGRAVSDAHRSVSLLKTLVGGLGDEQGSTARGQYTDLFRTGLAAAAKLDDPSEAAFFLESGRAGSLLESLDARDALRHAALPDDLRLAEATARAGESRALVAYTKALDGGDLAVIRARNDDLVAARAKVQEVVERIQREAKKEARLWYPVATPIEDLQGFLASGDALVLYGLADKDDPAHALVLTREEARIVALGPTSAVVAACEALEAHDASIDPVEALKRLRDLVVTPLGLPKEAKRLLVSPEGPLSYVPFAALTPEFVVAYQASGSTYGVLREEKDKRGSQVLALADPDYAVEYAPISLGLYAPGALASTGPTRGGRLAPLPGTRIEATAVADVKLFGKDASEAGLRAALAARTERWHAVHFACHGLVNPDRPTLSSLALTPDGANDGFLTALEVLQMQIPSDLVVLSACETGKGKIAGGEGIVGLTRAFMYAGSPRVICSLWKVDDAATAALMTKFYELWSPKDGSTGLPTAEALRQAQAFVQSQEKWKHPYYWAAWVLWGLPD